ncbi:MAG: hypothetical protein M3Q85_05085 [Acidobacteriota bacterium]|nr:hypothetical protein [Acidobacteriota bacterium]
MDETFTYHPLILEELARHGLKPVPGSAPAGLRDAVRDLYKYEIKRLRGELLAGRFPKSEYAAHIIELRRRYWVLSVPTHLWTRDPSRDSGGGEAP